ncbi:MAG: extracellular solute-binding protein [Halanaerobiaceae bacterium]
MSEDILRIWLIITSHEKEVISYLDREFEIFEMENNVKIDIKLVTWNRAFELLIEAFKNGESPDVIQIGTTWVRTLAYMGYLHPVPDSIKMKTSFSKDMSSVCQYKGQQIAIPWNLDTVVMVGRKDYMDQLGIIEGDLWDWGGFYRACSEITAARKKNSSLPRPLAFALRAEVDTLHRFASLLWARGWEFPNLNKGLPRKILTDNIPLETFSALARLMRACAITSKDVEKHPYQINEDFYNNGSYVFYIGSWYGVIEDINKKPEKSKNGDFKYTVLPLPSSINKLATYGGGSVLAVSSGTKNPELSWKLIRFLLQDNFIDEYFETTGKVPAFESSFWQRRFEDERVQMMYGLTVNARSYPSYPAWATIENILSLGIAHGLWRLIDKVDSEVDREVYTILQKADRDLLDLLNLSWEMNDYE